MEAQTEAIGTIHHKTVELIFEGEKRCRVDVQTKDHTHDLDRLVSMTLSMEGTTVDLIEFTGSKGARIFLRKKPELHGYYDGRGNVVTDPIESPSDIALFLHEMGHWHQDRCPELKDAMSYYIHFLKFVPTDRERIDDAVKSFPETAFLLDTASAREYFALLDQMDEIRVRINAVLRRKGEIERDFGDSELAQMLKNIFSAVSGRMQFLAEDLQELERHNDSVYRRLQALFHGLPEEEADRGGNAIGDGSAIRDILLYPIRLVEKDADDRANEWVLALEKLGIDLTGEYDVRGERSTTIAKKLHAGRMKHNGGIFDWMEKQNAAKSKNL